VFQAPLVMRPPTIRSLGLQQQRCPESWLVGKKTNNLAGGFGKESLLKWQDWPLFGCKDFSIDGTMALLARSIIKPMVAPRLIITKHSSWLLVRNISAESEASLEPQQAIIRIVKCWLACLLGKHHDLGVLESALVIWALKLIVLSLKLLASTLERPSR